MKPGDVLGTYRVVSELGAGGMGEVYQARDTALNRDVAIKVLPEGLAGDADRLARFQREAEALAALNHPNIAQVYGLERSGDAPAIVMELVEGPTLADRITGGAIPLDEALPIARQIAEALEAAHERGIIHRDLKPANVKVKDDGTVKVLDFGLAKAMADGPPEHHAEAETARANSPTMTSPAVTQMGVILGTAAYMSPEQARGKPVDKRTDIWAFGAVLFEMLTGRRAFAGATTLESLAATLERPLDWTVLPAATPPSVRRILRRALVKDPRKRLRDIADAKLELDDAGTEPDGSTERPQAAPSRIGLIAGLVTVAGLLGWLLLNAWSAQPPAASTQIQRLEVVPEGPLAISGGGLAVSSDGQFLVYAAEVDGITQLYLRPMDRFEASPIAGTEGASRPAFSPDGAWIAFEAEGTIKKVRPTEGNPIDLCPTAAGYGLGWESNESIVFHGGPSTGLQRCPADAGGAASPVTGLAPGELEHRHPQILPGGRAVLYTALRGGGLGEHQVVVRSLQTDERQRIDDGIAVGFLATGHLLYFRAGTVFARTFDPTTFDVGPPVDVIHDVQQGPDEAPLLAWSPAGVLAYAVAGASSEDRLVWVDRTGREEATPVVAPRLQSPRLDRNQRVAVERAGTGAAGDVFWYDSTDWIPSSVAQDGTSSFPVWSRAGDQLAYALSETDRFGIAIQTLGSGSVRRIDTGHETILPLTWSGDDRLAAVVVDEVTGQDIFVFPVDDPSAGRFVVQTPDREGAPSFSPDGTLIAYVTDRGGEQQVRIRAVDGTDEDYPISQPGGNEPLWVGNEVFYRQGNALMAVEVATTPEVSVGGRQELFERAYVESSAFNPNYAVSPDGQRFLMVKRRIADRPARIQVVLNWLEELKARVPVR